MGRRRRSNEGEMVWAISFEEEWIRLRTRRNRESGKKESTFESWTGIL